MKVNTWLVIALVLVGFLVGAVSLYFASLSGVMSKMGLVSGDFSQAVDKNALARLVLTQKGSTTECGVVSTAVKVPKYFVAGGGEKIALSLELGGERVICGIRHVQSGNVERGVYTLMKGLYYLKGYYIEMRKVVESDRSNCKSMNESDYAPWIEGYLRATEGRVHELVQDVYKQVESERARVDELCRE
jgi:hypothetical protein